MPWDQAIEVRSQYIHVCLQPGQTGFFPLSGMMISVEMLYTTLLKHAYVLQHFKRCR